jgi:hypothetical protein
VDFNKGRGLFRTFANPFEAQHEGIEPTLQLELMDLHCCGEFSSKLKERPFDFYKCLPKDKYPNLRQKAVVVQVCLEIYM